MNLTHKSPHIDPEDPFKSDLLGRRDEVSNLSLLVKNVNTPAVFAINSRWGTGKTTFIKLWENQLRAEGVPSLYFNAWETDFSDDPLVSFLGEMNDGLVGSSKKPNEAWEKTKAAGKQIAKRGIPTVIRIGTAGAVDADKIIEDEIARFTGSLAGDALDSYLKQKNAISDFRKSLRDFVNDSSNGGRLVVFVDELDRCRPDYAIELLERIKHLFNIEGLVFVLALDKEQLSHSVGAIYGNGIDSDGYLRRFIDFEYQLKRPDIAKYIESLFMSLDLDRFFAPRKKHSELAYDKEHLSNVLGLLASGLHLSLREVEQILASINIAVRTAKENEYLFPALLAFLVVAKNFNPDAYWTYAFEASSETELVDYLYEIVPDEDRRESFPCALVEGLLIAAKQDRFSSSLSPRLVNHDHVMKDEKAAPEDKRYSEMVLHVARRPAGVFGGLNLRRVIDRIEWMSRFDFFESDGE